MKPPPYPVADIVQHGVYGGHDDQLERASGYSPVAAMARKFPQAPLQMFKVAGVAGAAFASKPRPIAFPGDDSSIQVAYVKSASDELRLAVCVRLSGSVDGYAYSSPIESEGGSIRWWSRCFWQTPMLILRRSW